MTTDRIAPEPRMCGVCHHILTPVEQAGGLLWAHGLNADHEPVPVPVQDPELKCDFCSAPDPTWQAECTPFLTSTNVVVPGVDFDQQDDGLWAACDTCADYIRRGDWQRLAYRSQKNFVRVSGMPTELASRLITHIQGQFRHHYTGEITRISR